MGSGTPKVGRKPIILPNFPRKLHENERNWTEGGGGHASLAPPLDLPLVNILRIFDDHHM